MRLQSQERGGGAEAEKGDCNLARGVSCLGQVCFCSACDVSKQLFDDFGFDWS